MHSTNSLSSPVGTLCLQTIYYSTSPVPMRKAHQRKSSFLLVWKLVFKPVTEWINFIWKRTPGRALFSLSPSHIYIKALTIEPLFRSL